MKNFIVVLVIIAVIGTIVYFWKKDDALTDVGQDNEVCTLDAMLCPDGSYVGRVPPSCQFAACPGATTTSTPTNSSIQDGTMLEADLKAS